MVLSPICGIHTQRSRLPRGFLEFKGVPELFLSSTHNTFEAKVKRATAGRGADGLWQDFVSVNSALRLLRLRYPPPFDRRCVRGCEAEGQCQVPYFPLRQCADALF